MSTVRLPGLRLTDHTLSVPLDYSRPEGEQITVFAREVVAPGRENDDLPWLLFLQGGPGGKSPRPQDRSGWLDRALKDHRVLLLDQRGTGRSTPVTARTMERLGTPQAQADYLSLFRADSIVRDAEAFRHAFAGGGRWSTLGQSYGGWCTLTYLSLAPDGLSACYVTGGLPGLDADAETVYRRTYSRVRAKNDEYYRRYPEDAVAVRQIADHVVERAGEDPVRLPDGGLLTVERLQTLGMDFGHSYGFETVHYLIEEAWDGGCLSEAFLAGVQHEIGFVERPLYAVLQEAIYCQGTASRWAAQRVRSEFADFDPAAPRLLFTGEMIYPWMFARDGGLRPFAEAADRLAAKSDWPALYDLDVLSRNTVPVAAVVYHDDMYVDADLSLQTARRVPGVRVWITNEYEHNGLRADGGRVLGRLIDMARGDV